MTVVEQTSVEIVDRLRVIQGLCLDIAVRLEDEASAQTIPRNYEYDGRRTALLEIADEIDKAMTAIQGMSDSKLVQEQVKTLLAQVEARKQRNLEAQQLNQEYQHNFRMNGLYFTPRGAVAGCEKALEWLNASLKLSDEAPPTAVLPTQSP